MPKIDFYILQNQKTDAELLIACRLLEKAYQQDLKVYVYVDQHDKAEKLNELLWTYRDISFVPHRLLKDPQLKESMPVEIADYAPMDNQANYDILFNLTNDLPASLVDFKRVIEIVPADNNAREQVRAHYRYYQDKEYELATHKINV